MTTSPLTTSTGSLTQVRFSTGVRTLTAAPGLSTALAPPAGETGRSADVPCAPPPTTTALRPPVTSAATFSMISALFTPAVPARASRTSASPLANGTSDAPSIITSLQDPSPVASFREPSINTDPAADTNASGPITGANTGIIASSPAMLDTCFNTADTDRNTSAWAPTQPTTEFSSRPQKPGGSSKRMPAARLITPTQASTAAVCSACNRFAASVVACTAAWATSSCVEAAAVCDRYTSEVTAGPDPEAALNSAVCRSSAAWASTKELSAACTSASWSPAWADSVDILD